MNFGETVSNNDLDASHYQYNINQDSIRRRVSNTSRKERKSFLKNTKENKKMMRVRSTLDFSQSNNISCFFYH